MEDGRSFQQATQTRNARKRFPLSKKSANIQLPAGKVVWTPLQSVARFGPLASYHSNTAVPSKPTIEAGFSSDELRNTDTLSTL